ncbi:hypothetical protein R3P38DRAFT_3296840, partial [Favolaschia claudopus]
SHFVSWTPLCVFHVLHLSSFGAQPTLLFCDLLPVVEGELEDTGRKLVFAYTVENIRLEICNSRVDTGE